MIPEADIVLHEMDPTPQIYGDGTNDVAEMIHYYQFIVAQNDIWKDPFFLIKKKCPLTFPPSGIPYDTQELQYVAIPFPK